LLLDFPDKRYFGWAALDEQFLQFSKS